MDQITIEAARRGDRTAQSALLRALQDPWFRFCLGVLGNEPDARDAAQETALRFLKDLPRFRGDSSISTWSMGIALNVTREMRRKMRLTTEYDDALHTPDLGARSPDSVEASASREESRRIVNETLRHLPERQREAVLLRFFENLSVEETANAMACATGTVKATVHQALRALKLRLEKLT